VLPCKAIQYYDYNSEMMRRLTKKMIAEGTAELKRTEISSNETRKYLTLVTYDKIPEETLENVPEILLEYYQEVVMPNRKRVQLGSQNIKNGKKEKKKKRRKTGEYSVSPQLRILSNAECAIFAHAAGAGAYIDERPFLLDTTAMLNDGRMYYYSSVEMKDAQGGYQTLIADEMTAAGERNKAIVGSRMNGVLISPNGTYFTMYVLGSKSITWSKNGETNMKRHITNVMVQHGLKSSGMEGAIFLYSGDKVLHAVLNQKPWPNRANSPLNVDMTYQAMYFIPQNRTGIRLVRAMCLPDWKHRMLSCVLDEKVIQAGNKEMDGFDPATRTFYDAFIVPDMVSLKIFRRRMEMSRNEDKYCIICFDYQEPFIRAEFQDFNVDIEVINTEQLLETMGV